MDKPHTLLFLPTPYLGYGSDYGPVFRIRIQVFKNDYYDNDDYDYDDYDYG